MSVKDKLLPLLESRRGEFISGEEAANKLGVSRAAVNKAVASLKASGLKIEAVTNKGYRLSVDSDIISAESIEKYLGEEKNNFKIIVLNRVSSTNTVLKEYAANGAAEGTVLIALEQSSGKGRFTRRFESPKDSGIYMSILLRPDINTSSAPLITTAAAVAVCEAAEKVSGRQTTIKWVNDVLIDSKKICGILTEAAIDIEGGSLDYAVLGIGINAYEPDGGFPEEIKNKAGYVFEKHKYDLRSRLAAEVIKSFMKYYRTLEKKEYLNSYREHCIVPGRNITVIKAGTEIAAYAVGIDDEFRLQVRYGDGSEEFLSSGEISIRL